MLQVAGAAVAIFVGQGPGRLLCSIGLFLSLVIGCVGAVWSAAQPDWPGWMAFAGFAFFLMAGVLAAQIFYEAEGWVEQTRRDQRAAKLMTAMQNGEKHERFVLYLRPYASTDQIAVEQTQFVSFQNKATGSLTYAAAADRFEFEAEMEKAMRGVGLMAALGRPLEHMGAGRIQVAEPVWKTAMGQLMEAAKLIILLPSPRSGTVWEIDRILTLGYLYKTIVVDPPDEQVAPSGHYEPAAEWEAIKSTFAQHGYDLPEDDREGQLVYFGDKRSPVNVLPLQLAGGGGAFDSGARAVKAFAKTIIERQRTGARGTEGFHA